MENRSLKAFALSALAVDKARRQAVDSQPESLSTRVSTENTESLHQLTAGGTVGRGLTLADLPGLEKRLRDAGWRVTRRGDTLVCKSRRKVWVQ